jgi:ribosomal protein L21
MRFTFANNVIAAAFLAAVVSHREEVSTDEIELELLEIRDGLTLEIEVDEDGLGIHKVTNGTGAEVSTLAQLEQAIADTIAIQPASEAKLDVEFEGLAAGGPDRTVLISKSGCVKVGCKVFTPQGADQVVAAAKRTVKGQKVKTFTTHSKNEATRHRVECDPYSYDLGNSILTFNEEDSEYAKDIIALGLVRDRLLRKTKPVKVAPFQIFPSKVKAKARKKRGKR